MLEQQHIPSVSQLLVTSSCCASEDLSPAAKLTWLLSLILERLLVAGLRLCRGATELILVRCAEEGRCPVRHMCQMLKTIVGTHSMPDDNSY